MSSNEPTWLLRVGCGSRVVTAKGDEDFHCSNPPERAGEALSPCLSCIPELPTEVLS